MITPDFLKIWPNNYVVTISWNLFVWIISRFLLVIAAASIVEAITTKDDFPNPAHLPFDFRSSYQTYRVYLSCADRSREPRSRPLRMASIQSRRTVVCTDPTRSKRTHRSTVGADTIRWSSVTCSTSGIGWWGSSAGDISRPSGCVEILCKYLQKIGTI